MSYILKTYGLTKTFDKNDAVSGVNMNVKSGEIYGFLGPNGAGKTTAMRLISNLIKPTAGEIEIFGEKIDSSCYEMFKRMGIIIEYPVFYETLTGEENLSLHCKYMGFYKKGAVDEALKMVNLTGISGKKVKNFSLGMKQRLGIARAIITMPELLILDEPINGLDPSGIKEMRELFEMLSKEYGSTILISTHILSEIEQIADRVGVINKGVLIKETSMNEIREENKSFIELGIENCNKAAYILENNLGIRNYKVMNTNTIRIYDDLERKNEISKSLILNDVNIISITSKNNTLEEYFLKLTEGGKINA